MTAPRCILEGSTYLVTRRTTQRQFLLTPSRELNEIIRYCAAHAAAKTNVEVHALCVLSNHYHCICTDHDGQIPEFARIFHRLVSRCLNASYGRWESLWSSSEPSYVRVEDDEDVLAKTVYTLANPVAAGLVSRASEWPGVLLFQPGKYLAKRPKVFFAEAGTMPKKIELEITAPPLGVPPKEATAVIKRALAAEESKIRAAFKETGRHFLGAKRVRAQNIYDSPTSREPRRRLSPRVAARDKWKRIEALQRLAEFVRAYKEALTRWRQGERDVVFPAGVYAMRRIHRVRCAPLLT